MKLTVIEYAGCPPTRELSALIQPPGGTVGRSTGCDLTLDDPERRLSQVQAMLTHRHDGWYLRNASPITPIEVNGQLLPLEQECRLQGGDHLRIGAYLIRSEANDNMPYPPQNSAVARFAQNPQTTEALGSPPSSGSNPFADLLSGAPLSAPPSQETPLLHLEDNGTGGQQRPWGAPSYFGQLPDASASLFAPRTPSFGNEPVIAQAPANASLDPLALFGEPTHHSDLLENLGPSSLSEPSTASPIHLGHTKQFPDSDQASFGDSVDIGRTAFRLGQFHSAPQMESSPSYPAFSSAEENRPSFGETGSMESAPLTQATPDTALELPPDGTDMASTFGQPLGSARVELDLEAFPTLQASSEPLPALQSSFAAPGPSMSTSEESFPTEFTAASSPLIDSIPPHPEQTVSLQPSKVLPERAEPQDILDIGDLAMRLAQIREQSSQPEAPLRAPESEQIDAQTAARAVKSFMVAAGIEQISVAPLPLDQRMAQLGRLFRLFADGTVRLLSSRALVKREVRAELTRVMNSANNPFKVLPSGEAVLIQMFGQHLPGFLSAEQAITESLEDLQRHQLGLLAGTRTALLGLIHQLDPELCQNEVVPTGLLDRLFPHRVESRRWHRYRQRYQSVLALARENDFYPLFGEIFLRAYEEEISRCTPVCHERNEEASA